ncbi:DUF2460 domain-containing protein [Sphingomonas quercus]|uniref:DUF2460 domain-containing protein n=1 Tax=Sphingomonas quercus TaxID=2842451 RepID=A0ABS6BJI4_9SPHN|nr:DUF2460 domain-containing protein [Sphingomonas quercus]MBU3078464.1 DUF2460 domain-containing protein [Sphingomonas quercus]
MGWWLAKKGDGQSSGWIRRFDPRFWTVNFPRPMNASVVTTGADGLRADAVFYRADDLAGLIWEAEDHWDHPLLGYETARDFRGLRLGFRWRSGGLMPLDAINGPTLTIEGRDKSGNPRAWYVRLWNYADGTPEDAAIALDFDAMEGGFDLPEEADPVWPGDVDRLFISLIPPDYTGEDTPLTAPAEAWVELSGIVCDGVGTMLPIGDVLVPPHGMRIATGYDDLYNVTPARMLRNILHLGYRGAINHYVGMSHYYRMGVDLRAIAEGGALNAPCLSWHRDFVARAKALGQDIILSLSYELLDENCPEAWKQRASDGTAALTGWDPPSTLLSPANAQAMAYLQTVARAFAGIAAEGGIKVRFQIGEPWWWIMPDRRICLYDDASRSALSGNPPVIDDVRAAMSAAQTALLDQAGALLAASTAALRDAVLADHPGAETLILVYLPTVLDQASPEVKRANVPAGWASPAFDVLQLEDYDWTTADDAGATARGAAAMQARLGYPVERQHYFAGFVLRGEQRAQWRQIDGAAEAARRRGVADTFLWALPQVIRDGFVHFETGGEADVQAFDDILFPLALGLEASVAPAFSTAVVTTAAGVEQRNADWADARMRFDVGSGVRSEADMQTLIAFFRARRGAARGFRFRDAYDDSSAGMTGAPTPLDQPLGAGDGVATGFPLRKLYGEQERRITRPVTGSVRVAVDGSERLTGWMLEAGGMVRFEVPVAAGAVVTAGFRFDVPVRFAEDRLDVQGETFRAGGAPSVPLIEIREALA